jgi:hypothetical protein
LVEAGSAEEEPGVSLAPPAGRSEEAAGTARGVGKRQMPFWMPSDGAREMPPPL